MTPRRRNEQNPFISVNKDPEDRDTITSIKFTTPEPGYNLIFRCAMITLSLTVKCVAYIIHNCSVNTYQHKHNLTAFKVPGWAQAVIIAPLFIGTALANLNKATKLFQEEPAFEKGLQKPELRLPTSDSEIIVTPYSVYQYIKMLVKAKQTSIKAERTRKIANMHVQADAIIQASRSAATLNSIADDVYENMDSTATTSAMRQDATELLNQYSEFQRDNTLNRNLTVILPLSQDIWNQLQKNPMFNRALLDIARHHSYTLILDQTQYRTANRNEINTHGARQIQMVDIGNRPPHPFRPLRLLNQHVQREPQNRTPSRVRHITASISSATDWIIWVFIGVIPYCEIIIRGLVGTLSLQLQLIELVCPEKTGKLYYTLLAIALVISGYISKARADINYYLKTELAIDAFKRDCTPLSKCHVTFPTLKNIYKCLITLTSSKTITAVCFSTLYYFGEGYCFSVTASLELIRLAFDVDLSPDQSNRWGVAVILAFDLLFGFSMAAINYWTQCQKTLQLSADKIQQENIRNIEQAIQTCDNSSNINHTQHSQQTLLSVWCKTTLETITDRLQILCHIFSSDRKQREMAIMQSANLLDTIGFLGLAIFVGRYLFENLFGTDYTTTLILAVIMAAGISLTSFDFIQSLISEENELHQVLKKTFWPMLKNTARNLFCGCCLFNTDINEVIITQTRNDAPAENNQHYTLATTIVDRKQDSYFSLWCPALSNHKDYQGPRKRGVIPLGPADNQDAVAKVALR